MNINENNLTADLIFCIENEEFRKYLEVSAKSFSGGAKFLKIENVPRTIADNTNATLILQSDKNEGIFFDIGKKEFIIYDIPGIIDVFWVEEHQTYALSHIGG